MIIRFGPKFDSRIESLKQGNYNDVSYRFVQKKTYNTSGMAYINNRLISTRIEWEYECITHEVCVPLIECKQEEKREY